MALLCSKKMIFFHEIFQVGACPNLKDSSIYDIFSIHMYRTYRVRYLQLFCPICDFLMLWKVHYFGKRWFFHEIFQVGACPNLTDSSLYEMNSIHMYKARSIWYPQQFLSICDSFMPCMVHFFFEKKRWFFMNYFKFVHAPTWKIPYYMTGFLSICTRQEALGIFNMPQLERFLIIWQVFYSYVQGKKHSISSTIFLYLRLSYGLYGTFFGKRWFFMKYFKLVQAPTWKIPYYMTGFLSICTRHKAFGIFNNFPLSATPSYPVRYIFLEKDEFLMKYFKLVHAPSWKIPQYMKIYLFICTRHKEFGIFNFFALSATP